MDPLTFVLGIAGNVIAELIVGFVNGRTQRVPLQDVEKLVAAAVDERLQQISLPRGPTVQHILQEVGLVAAHPVSPIIEQDGSYVLRTPPPLAPALESAPQWTGAEIASRLGQLKQVIEQRRVELLGAYPELDVISHLPPPASSDAVPRTGDSFPSKDWPQQLQKRIDDRRQQELPNLPSKDAGHDVYP